MTLEPFKLPSLLKHHHISPRKSLGQNFLVDDGYLRQIVQAAKVTSDTNVLEIGAGAGNLTRHLAHAAREVVAVEIDQSLFPLLKDTTASFKNIRLVQGDILEQNIAELMPRTGYMVVANIPYYITSALIRFLLESPRKPSRLVLTIQQEVARRVCASAGDLSLLALSVQLYGDPRVALRVPAGAFYPVPNVDSAVLIVDLYPEPLIPSQHVEDFFRLAKSAFSQKRKMLRNTLASAPGLDKDSAIALLEQSGIDARRRAQTLTIQEWKVLTDMFRSVGIGE